MIQGRSKIFVMDSSDAWDNTLTMGLGEAVSRIGSPSLFDKRGQFYFYDTFEYAPLKWTIASSTPGGGTGHYAKLDNINAHMGSGSVKLAHPNISGDTIYITKYVGGICKNKVGLETTFTLNDSYNLKPQFLLDIYTGTKHLRAGIRFENWTQGGLSYLNHMTDYISDTSWTSFNTNFYLTTGVPYPIKFIVDTSSNNYVRCIFEGTEIDMSTYSVPSAALPFNYGQYVNMIILIKSTSTNNYSINFDNVIFTVEEP